MNSVSNDIREGISVIIPVYNAEEWIDKCLESEFYDILNVLG